MFKSNLDFKPILENKSLVSDSNLEIIENIFTEEEQREILVAEIDTHYIDGVSLCNHYHVPYECGANCLVVECKRGANKKYVALVVPVGYKYNMSSTVRKYTNSRMVSVAPLEYVLDETKMEQDSINPFGIPIELEIFVDPKVLDSEKIVCGSGLRKSKLMLPSKYLLKLPNVVILDNLAKEG